MKPFFSVLFFFALSSAQALAAGNLTCNATCGYGPYRCLTNELRRTYTLSFANGGSSVTVNGGGVSGTYSTRKVGVYGDFTWSQPWSGSRSPIGYRYSEQLKSLDVDIRTEKKESDGSTLFLTNYYRGYCK